MKRNMFGDPRAKGHAEIADACGLILVFAKANPQSTRDADSMYEGSV